MEEVWKDIENYEGIYQISNLGRIRSLDRIIRSPWKNGIIRNKPIKGKILKLGKPSRGYLRIEISNDTLKEKGAIHRIVAMAFIPNPDNKPFVNHIDGNKLNNYANNLEWCTASENIQHAYRTGLRSYEELYTWGIKGNIITQKKINKVDEDGNIIESYTSIADASRKTSLNRTYIRESLRNLDHSKGKFVFNDT